MSSQTSNSRFQTPQQSRAVYSNPSLSSSLDHKNRGLLFTCRPGAPQKMDSQYFEEYGLRVPLFKLKQKRLHVRLASEFASKSKKDLFNLAKDITNGQASKLKNPSRSELAVYIERVETLALGPHPKTTLPSTKKEDLIEALGVKTTAPRAKRNKTQKEAPRQKRAPLQQATPPEPSPEEQTAPAPVKTAHVAQKPNKRKYDSADAPSDAEQTPVKKIRVISTPCVDIHHVSSVSFFSPCSPNEKMAPEASDPEPPFLKPGIHGRGGDFGNDPNRATGRGHRVNPQDLARRRAYDAMYHSLKYRTSKHAEWLAELKREEEWMRAYRERYPGEVVGHLWDCGCEMVGDGEESEEE